MAATATIPADATRPPPPPATKLSDAAGVAAWDLALGTKWTPSTHVTSPHLPSTSPHLFTRRRRLDPGSLRAFRQEGQASLWHYAAHEGRTDVCEYLKSKGLLDLLDRRSDGFTPLLTALLFSNEEAARWMVANGADVNASNTTFNATVFILACAYMSLPFVEELAGKVAPEHLVTAIGTPMQSALVNNPEPTAVVRTLVLRGIPVRPKDFPAAGPLLSRHRELLTSLEADLTLNDRTFLGLFLAAGVHAPNTTPACTTTTITVTAKRVRTQRPDGSWSDPVAVPCEPRLAVTAAPTIRRSGRVAARVEENHLPKLRGFGNTEVRMEIAVFLGVQGQGRRGGA